MIRGLSRLLIALGLGALLAGCSSVEGFFSHRDPNADSLNLGANPRPVGKPAASPGEKPTVLPVAPQDINCPTVDVAEGGASLRVGGPDNAAVRYQFNIGDTARECNPAGPGQAVIKIGVAGEVVIGPAGSPGAFSAPLKITITRESDKKAVFSKTYRIEAATNGVSAGAFRIVTDPIPVPLTTLRLADQYTISVGFEGAGAAPAVKRHRRRAAG